MKVSIGIRHIFVKASGLAGVSANRPHTFNNNLNVGRPKIDFWLVGATPLVIHTFSTLNNYANHANPKNKIQSNPYAR